jgi:hypothetical protein
MQIHPLFRLVATQPELLADHAGAYAGLVGEELGKTAAAWKLRIVLNIVALSLLAVSVVLTGVALMLWATVPTAQIQAVWALIAAPAVPAVFALGCALAGREKYTSAFADISKQLTADLAMLREASVA